MAEQFDFDDWATKANLKPETIQKLVDEDLTSIDVLIHLTKEDIEYLKLTLGERKRLQKAVANLVESCRNDFVADDNVIKATGGEDKPPTPKTPTMRDDDEIAGEDEVDSTKNTKVLILNDEWGTSKGGISTVHRQIASEAKKAGCGVLVTSLKPPPEEDRLDAEQKGIDVITATPKGKAQPDLSWINVTHKTFYPDLEKIQNLDVIIGHIPVTSEGARDIRRDRLQDARVFQFAHTIPEDTDIFKDGATPMTIEEKEERIIALAKKCDVFFSVGPRIYNHYDGKFRRLTGTIHEQYVPYPDEGFFKLEVKPPQENHPVRILTCGRIDGVGNLKGYDILAEALSQVCQSYKDVLRTKYPKWDIRGIPAEKHEESQAFITKHVKNKYLKCVLHPYGTQEEIMEDLKQSHLFIMPSRSEPFGMVGLEALAAGVPVLITKHSGLAEFIEQHFVSEAESMIVDVGLNDVDREGDIVIWRERIISTLTPEKYPGRFDKAQSIKDKLRSLPAVRETHDKFRELLKSQ